MEAITLFVKHSKVDDLHGRVREGGSSPSQVETRGVQTSPIQQLPEHWDACWDSAGSTGSVHTGVREQGDLRTGKAKVPW